MKMSVNPVAQANVTPPASNAPVKPVNKEAPQSNPHPTATVTVQISSAARAALQEATETAAQTAKEAQSGDVQAQRLLASRAAAEEATESPLMKSQEV
jgi:hypothetical protein